MVNYSLGEQLSTVMREDVTMESAKPVKIMQIIARMNVGGPAVLVADLVRNLDIQRFSTVLVTGYCDENESDYLNEVARDVFAIRVPGLGRSVSPLKDLTAFFLLIKEIRRFKPDVIHTHTAKAGVLGRIAGLIARPQAKRVHTFHGHLLHGYFSPSKTRLVILFERVLGLITFRFIAIGNNVKKDLVLAGIAQVSNFEVIYPGLQELDRFPKSDARSTLGLDPSKKYLVFVGRLTSIKRPERLIDLARFLKDEHPESWLLIAGAGELLDELSAKAQKEELPMTFFGWRKDIGAILSASDIAVLCSDNEGIPLTLIQASQAGLPIVSTDVGSVSDIVISGTTGLLTEVSSKGLIEGVSTLLDDPALCERFGKAGQERAQEFFSSRAMIEHHQRLYSQTF
jgi:glycosyltransferase involved in cell wall biosynthesis